MQALLLRRCSWAEGFEKNHNVVYNYEWLFLILVFDLLFLMSYVVSHHFYAVIASGLFLCVSVVLSQMYTKMVKSLYLKKRKARRLASR